MTRTLIVCNGKVGTTGYCSKCYKKGLTTSSVCGQLLPYEPDTSHPEHELIKIMKLKVESDQLKPLMTKHIFLLSEDELRGLAFILDIEISQLEKTDWQISFKMSHKLKSVFVECSENSNCSIGSKKKGKDGSGGLTSWGGCFSFAGAVSIFRNFFSYGYELTMQSPEKLKVYKVAEWQEIVLSANALVEAY